MIRHRLRALSFIFLWGALGGERLFASCASPANAIEAENCLTGNPKSEWDLPNVDAGDLSIQGFATEVSVNKGETVHFKIDTDASDYTIDIYRIGYYSGNGARKVATVSPSASLPQDQPACTTESGTGLIDCGNWSESASWTAPSTVVSGVYFARLRRTDTGGASHIVFIVRDDASTSDILFQTSDTTWQAYNSYGGNSFYTGNGGTGRAFKVSYNRPVITRSNYSNHVFAHEYPMIRWLESNAFDVTYFAGVDSDRHGGQVLNHRLFLSVGHDEYWSKAQRAAIENAENAGVHMAFLSGNEMYWKTRYENSIDGADTPYRTLVCYKESYESHPIDPQDPPTWTGTWRDPRFSPPADGGNPENKVIGQLYTVDAYRQDALVISANEGKMRFWRNTAAANLSGGSTLTFPQTVGYEWDEDLDNGARPAGIIHLSSETYFVDSHVYTPTGTVYRQEWATHHLTLFKHPSGAQIFAAGSMQWSWGLDDHHDEGSQLPPVTAMRQATVNLFADMGIQPGNLQSGLVAGSPSSDHTPPTSTITSPLDGDVVTNGVEVIIAGTAADSGGNVGGVEVSVDNGVSWHPATGWKNWTYRWIPNISGTVTLLSRATDDSLNVESPSGGVHVGPGNPTPFLASLSPAFALPGGPAFNLTITGSNFMSSSVVRWNGSDRTTTYVSSGSLKAAISAADIANVGLATITVFNPTPGGGSSVGKIFPISNVFTIWPATATPFTTSPDPNPIEVGVKFRSDSPGQIVGIRFYKHSTNTGTHIGNLWSSTGTLLGQATFSSESSSGWQQANFSSPVTISPNVTYVASYFTTKGYAVDKNYFTNAGVDNPPLHALKSGVDGLNGLYKYSATSVFPTNSYAQSNYWIDVAFSVPSSSNPVPALSSLSPSSATVGGAAFTLTATGSNFIPASVVRWNGADRATTYVSATQIRITVPANDLIVAATVPVTVFNPVPGGGLSSAQIFTVANPIPSVTSLTPTNAQVGDSTITLTVNGSNFLSSSVVRWNGSDRPTVYVSATQLTANITTADLAARGLFPVTVVNPGPGGGTSAASTFAVRLVPSISDLAPSSATAGGPAFSLTVNGTNYASDSVVQWNGGNRTTTFVSPTQLTASIPAGDIASTGTATVRVSNPVPGGLSNSQSFSINESTELPAPVISNLNPSTAQVGDPELTLTVNGSNFVDGAVVRWNGSDRTTTFISSGSLQAAITTADLGSRGISTVTVMNPPDQGGGSNGKTFSVCLVPALSSLSPSSATAGGSAFTLTVNGSNFANDSVVKWNGASRSTTFVSNIKLTASITAADIATVGTDTVTVVNAAPGGTSNLLTFQVKSGGGNNPVPTLSSLNPSNIVVGSSSFTLTVTGTKYVPSSVVRWNGSDRVTTYISATSLSAVIPASDLTERAYTYVTVFNPAPAGGTSGQKTFTIRLVPVLTSISPGSKPAGDPEFTLTAVGTDFVPDSIIQWKGNDRTTVYVSSIQLTATILAADIATAGSASVRVFNPSPGGFSGNKNFNITNGGGGGMSVNGIFNAPDLARVEISPNPWQAKLHSGSPMTFGKLTPSSEINIFTISGQWIKRLTSSGNSAAWDLTNDSGERVASGYYLYIVMENGQRKRKGELAIIQ